MILDLLLMFFQKFLGVAGGFVFLKDLTSSGVIDYVLLEHLGVGRPNTLLAESTSDSTVLDNLSINGLLAQYVQKAGRLSFGYPNGLLAKIAHSFLSVAVLTFKTK